jgi:hypothetical protein
MLRHRLSSVVLRVPCRSLDYPTTPNVDQLAAPRTIMSLFKSRPAWLMLAIASGGCAAINGVFAKLYCPSFHSASLQLANDPGSTTTELTTSWASSIAAAFGLSPSNKLVELAIRGVRRPLCTSHTKAHLLTAPIALLRAQSRIQRRHVGTLYARSDSRFLHRSCQYH